MKTKVFVVIVVILLGGFLVYLYYAKSGNSETSVSTQGGLDQNASTPTNQGTVIGEKTDNYEITGRYANESLLGATEVNAYINSYISDFKAQANEDVPNLAAQGSAIDRYTLEMDTVSYAGTQYVFHVLTTGEYTGGASTNATVQTFAYKVSNKLKVDLSEFVPEGKRDHFINEVKKKLRDTNADIGVFDDVVSKLTFEDLKSFYVYDGNLIILFSKYEVAPGAAGIISIKIPLTEI